MSQPLHCTSPAFINATLKGRHIRFNSLFTFPFIFSVFCDLNNQSSLFSPIFTWELLFLLLLLPASSSSLTTCQQIAFSVLTLLFPFWWQTGDISVTYFCLGVRGRGLSPPRKWTGNRWTSHLPEFQDTSPDSIYLILKTIPTFGCSSAG